MVKVRNEDYIRSRKASHSKGTEKRSMSRACWVLGAEFRLIECPESLVKVRKEGKYGQRRSVIVKRKKVSCWSYVK